MKTLKKIGLLMVAVLSMMTSSVWAAGGGGGGGVTTVLASESINPLDIARAFALKPPYAHGGSWYGDMLIGQQWVRTYMFWQMDKYGAITALEINGVQIPLPEPIYGLPMGDGGLARNVWISLDAVTESGENAGSGSLYKEIVSKGDSLIVTLIPASITQVIPVSVAGNDNVQLTIENFTYGYGWWVADGQLHVSLPPVGGSYDYVVRDGRGNVIGTGVIKPFQPVIAADDAYIGVALLGNVQGAEFTQPDGRDDWTSLSSLKMDCSIPTDGGGVAGKVIYVDCASGGLQVSVYGDYSITVQSATSSGDMPQLQLEDHSVTQPGWTMTQVNTTDIGIGKVVITIIPKPGNTAPNPWLNLHRFYVSPSNGGIKN